MRCAEINVTMVFVFFLWTISVEMLTVFRAKNVWFYKKMVNSQNKLIVKMGKNRYEFVDGVEKHLNEFFLFQSLTSIWRQWCLQRAR